MAISRLRVTWTNWPGAPGYSNFFFSSLTPNSAAVATFFDAIKAQLPTGLTIQFPGSGDILSETTGQLTGDWSQTAPTSVVGTGTGSYPGSCGAVVHWLSSSFVRGRRLRGRTFLVPLSGGSYDSAGSLNTGPQGTFQAAANALVTATAGDMVVWSRPGLQGAGSVGPVTSARVPDLAVVMRSRRT